MDRLNRMLQAAQGMGMGGAAPGGVRQSVVYMVSPCVHSSQATFVALDELHIADKSSTRTPRT